MSTTTSNEVLKDLIEINNDRVAGFRKASKDLESDDQDLKNIFEEFASQSEANVTELRALAGPDFDEGTSVLGGIHRTWIDIKATFSGHDRKSILEECERGEDAIKKAYKTAMQDSAAITPAATAVLSRQQQGINQGHDRIKALRDAQV